MKQVVAQADEASPRQQDGAGDHVRRVRAAGNPENLISAIHRKGVKNLTVILETTAGPRQGLASCCRAGRSEMVASYVGEKQGVRATVPRRRAGGRAEPQGTLAEAHPGGRSRAGRLLHTHGGGHADRRRRRAGCSMVAR